MHTTRVSAILAGLGGALAMGSAAPDAEAGHYSIGPVHAPTYVSSPYGCAAPVVVPTAPLVYPQPGFGEYAPVYQDYNVYTRPHPVRPRYLGHHGRHGYDGQRRHHGNRRHHGRRGHHRRGFGFSFGFGFSR